jgi:ABC-type branched-subunit amino acid transport system substrate-binding protein
MRIRFIVLFAVLAVVAVACGNSSTTGGSTASSSTGGATGGTVAAADLSKNVKVDAVGVTDTEILVGGVASKTNPLGGNYGEAFKGAQAYFDMVNDKGGIYGRKIKVVKNRDDQVVNNQAEVQGLISQDKVFAVVPVATLVFSGAELLTAEKVPTFGWNINPEFSPGPNLFGEKGSSICFDCARSSIPWVAKQVGAKKVGILGYGISDQSKQCAKGDEASFKKYPVAEVAYMDSEVPFGETNLSVQVQKMKAAGVDFVVTCMDTNGVTTLAKEMQKQGLAATQFLQNAYDPDFIDKFGDLFQKSIVGAGAAPFEMAAPPPGLQNYLTWIKKAGGTPSEVSMAGWLAADLFVTGLKAAGPEFSRQKVIDALNQMTNWNAEGASPGVDWTRSHDGSGDTTCTAFLQIRGKEYVQVYNEPGKAFTCLPNLPDTLPDQATFT